MNVSSEDDYGTSFTPDTTTIMAFPLNSSFTDDNLPSPSNDAISAVVYCSESWRIFWIPFRNNYTSAKLALCLLGLVTNILNVIVFTRKRMRSSTNLLLTTLAIADLMCVARELQFIFWGYAQLTQWGTYGNAVNELVNEILLTLFHTWSVYLTVTIAFWRLLGILWPLKSRRWCTWNGAKGTIFVSALSAILVSILMYCSIYIGQNPDNGNFNWTYGSALTWDIYVWANAILIKTAPSIILTLVIGTIVKSLLEIKMNRKKLLNLNSGTLFAVGNRHGKGPTKKIDESSIRVDHHPHPDVQIMNSVQKPVVQPGQGHGMTPGSGPNKNDKIEFDRTTRMLLVVLLLFVLTELPAGVGLLFNGIFGYKFFMECREPALAFFNFCDYISSATNLFVYLIMGERFRATFFDLFTPKGKWWCLLSGKEGKSESGNGVFFSGQSDSTVMSA